MGRTCAEHVSCGEMATAFISVGAYYAHPQRLKISRDCHIKDESCDELPVPSNQRFTSCRSLLRIERPDGFNSGRMTALWQGLH
jgi:hypothetical protein